MCQYIRCCLNAQTTFTNERLSFSASFIFVVADFFLAARADTDKGKLNHKAKRAKFLIKYAEHGEVEEPVITECKCFDMFMALQIDFNDFFFAASIRH